MYCLRNGNMSELPPVSSDFLDENEKLCQTKPQSKKSGPYSKKQRESRRNEVYRLHFDYGYSARKIAELMKINRNTINGDIDYWYVKIVDNNNFFNPAFAIILIFQRLKVQRSRLREQLDKAGSQEKSGLERLMFDIDSKIAHTNLKMCASMQQNMDTSMYYLNKWMKDNKKTERYMTLFDRIAVSDKSKEKIDKIIKEDRLQVDYM